MDGQEPSHIAIGVLTKQVLGLSETMDRKFGEVNTTLTGIQVSIGRIDERTQGDNRAQHNVGENSWKWAAILVTILGLAMTAFGMMITMHKG